MKCRHSMPLRYCFGVALLALLALISTLAGAKNVHTNAQQKAEVENEMLEIPSGTYRPFFKRLDGAQAIDVPSFKLQSEPISKSQFLDFVRKNPAWRRSQIKPVWAERSYLEDWHDDLDPGANADEPVTSVSWFAARAYCREQGGSPGRLPSVAEWERVAGKQEANDSGIKSPLNPRAQPVANPFGFAMGAVAADLQRLPLRFGAVWEWTEDFNSAPALEPAALTASASRFCGDGIRSNNAADYAAFLRYSLRSSLRANYTLKNLGFRCAN